MRVSAGDYDLTVWARASGDVALTAQLQGGDGTVYAFAALGAAGVHTGGGTAMQTFANQL
jgi:hypothetical protein